MQSKKYPRTYHFPFSPGTTSDDRIAYDFEYVCTQDIIITEKLDGENTCLNQYGVFARSHGAPTQNPWANFMWDKWRVLEHELGDLEIFGESLYAIHSIIYTNLQEYYYIFGIRQNNIWLSWEEIELYSNIVNIPIVPVLYKGKLIDWEYFNSKISLAQNMENLVQSFIIQNSKLNDAEIGNSPTEGVVVRVANAFNDEDFAKCVFKWVRKNHVKTDAHWTRNWQRARLNHELKK